VAKRRFRGSADLEPIEATHILTVAIVGFVGFLVPLVSPAIFSDNETVAAAFGNWKSAFFFSMLFSLGGCWLADLLFRTVRNSKKQ